MMKTESYKGILLMACCLLCFAGCKKDEFERVSLNVNLESPAGQKTHIDGFSLFFDADDTIKLNNESVLLSGEKLDVEMNDNGYWAVFPKTTTITDTMITTTITPGAGSIGVGTAQTVTRSITGAVQVPVEQDYELIDGFQKLNGPMAAHLNDSKGTLYFKNLYSVLKVVVTAYNEDVAIHQIRVTSLSEDGALAGTVNFDLSAATTPDRESMQIKSDDFSNTQDIVQLNFTTPYTVHAFEDKAFHLVVMPLEQQQLKVEIMATKNGEGVKYTYTTPDEKTLERSCVGRIPINLQAAEIDPWADLYGDFSVNPIHKVRFSPGNLQYNLNTGKWRFAEHEYDVVEQTGDSIGNAYAYYKSHTTHGGWMSLFGWATSGWQDSPCREAYLPNATIVHGYNDGSDAYYLGGAYDHSMVGDYAHADWGVHNSIYNPKTGVTDPAGTWRTLTQTEWSYLLKTRKELFNNTQWCADVVQVNFNNGTSVKGIIVYPDGIRSKPAGISATIDGKLTTTSSAPVEATLTEHEYNLLVGEGCAFLPATGYRHRYTNPTSHVMSRYVNKPENAGRVMGVNTDFFYWSASFSSDQCTAGTGPQTASCYPTSWPTWNSSRWYGGAVRLVQDVEKPASN